MELLRNATLYIKSQSNLEDPVRSMTIFKKHLLSDDARAPKSLFKFQQLIPTVIGTFMIDIDLSYAIDLTFSVDLR